MTRSRSLPSTSMAVKACVRPLRRSSPGPAEDANRGGRSSTRHLEIEPPETGARLQGPVVEVEAIDEERDAAHDRSSAPAGKRKPDGRNRRGCDRTLPLRGPGVKGNSHRSQSWPSVPT